ncbi:Neural proliferation differentiation and control protein 1, partial [Pseudolycoriella hygida]
FLVELNFQSKKIRRIGGDLYADRSGRIVKELARLRKPPQSSNWGGQTQNENAYLLTQLTNIIEEQARRHYQQQLEQQQKNLQLKHQHNHGPSAPSDDDYLHRTPEFSYEFPEKPPSDDDAMPFAISPADPRYYDSTTELRDGYDRSEDDNVQYAVEQNKVSQSLSTDDNVPSYKMKAPMEVKPKTNNNLLSSKSMDVLTRNDLKLLVEQLQKNGQEDVIINTGLNGRFRSDVIKKHMEMDSTMGMYVVALIAGISAAVTVGLIALGIGWYTLHRKGIAAADVEYPAYGVTGPNKEISPNSPNRRLAQSAQMYHYQHQKQQIIAMENRGNSDRNTSLSDVESDDENEEGDYTVYECPGLAPTGEMEVKNPLFLDDPTPATPANANNTKKSSQTLPSNSSPAKSNQTNESKK